MNNPKSSELVNRSMAPGIVVAGNVVKTWRGASRLHEQRDAETQRHRDAETQKHTIKVPICRPQPMRRGKQVQYNGLGALEITPFVEKDVDGVTLARDSRQNVCVGGKPCERARQRAVLASQTPPPTE